MRIDSYTSAADQITTDASSKQSVTPGKGSSGASATEDRATLTSDSTSVTSLVSTALKFPEVRQDKVNELKQSVSNGTYQVDPSKIASSILEQG